MHCARHSAESIGVCAYCGRAMCPECEGGTTVPRLVCSPRCGEALARDAQVIQSLLDRSTQNARASAFYCYLTSGLSASAGVAAWFMLPSPFLIYFTLACAVALLLSGLWYQRGARRRPLPA